MKVILISSYGNPTNPKLWSGTPRNLFESFSKLKEIEIESHFALRFYIFHKLIMGIEYAFGLWPKRSLIRKVITTMCFLAFLLFKRPKNTLFIFFEPVIFLHKIFFHESNRCFLILDATVVQWRSVIEYQNRHLLSNIKNQIFSEKIILKSYNGFFAFSEAAADSLKVCFEVPSEIIWIIRTGTGQSIKRVKTYRESGKEIKSVLLIAKNEHWRKGVDLAIAACQSFELKETVQLHAVLGPNSEFSNSDNVYIYETLPKALLERLFNEADLFLLPCRFEPYGLVFVEAVECGLPLVLTKESGIGPLLIHRGWPGEICEANVQDIVKGISNLLFGEKIITDLILQDKVMEDFNWDLTVDVILKKWKKEY